VLVVGILCGGTLERAIRPFPALCGPPTLARTRSLERCLAAEDVGMTMTLERPLNSDIGTGEPTLERRPVPLRGLVSHRLRAAGSLELVARSLTQLVEDAFVVEACSSIPHLRDALDQPIAAATATAVDTLIDELADLLDLLPETAANVWNRARLEADLGYE